MVGQTSTFNILSLDGGGIKNIITLKVMDLIERYACDYVTQAKKHTISCTDGRILVKDMFNMVAGSSTAGILAAAFVSPVNGTNTSFSAGEILN